MVANGTYGPQANNLPPLMSFDPETVVQHLLASYRQMAYDNNATLKANYLDRFNMALKQYALAQIDETALPQPPDGFVVVVTDGEAGKNFALVQQAPTVCDMPAYTKRMVLPSASGPMHIHILQALGNGWFSAGQDDTFPAGMKTPAGFTADDGAVGEFQKFSSPVGPGWYFKVA